MMFFISIAVASLAGGTVHGFFSDPTARVHRLLWPLTMLAVGITAATGWVITGFLFANPPRPKRWMQFAVVSFIPYAIIVIFVSRSFTVVILNYLPAMAVLLGVCVRRARDVRRDMRSSGSLGIACGLGVSFVAALIQQARLGIHPQYFNFNATYHLVQAFGLAAIFRGAQRLLGEDISI